MSLDQVLQLKGNLLMMDVKLLFSVKKPSYGRV